MLLKHVDCGMGVMGAGKWGESKGTRAVSKEAKLKQVNERIMKRTMF